MADSTVKEVLGEISKAAASQGVEFRLHRQGRKHHIYHLGETVVLPVPHSKVPGRIRYEMFKACEPELGYRWWMPAERKIKAPKNLPKTAGRGYRGPRGRAVTA